MEDRRIELDYVFDRLGEAQLVQVYRLLVPERRRLTGREGDSDDDSGDLRAGFVGPAKRGTDHSQPDLGASGSRGRDGVGRAGAVGVRR
jgi:hypothetical protein